MYVILFQGKKLCVIVVRFVRQFYVNNLRTLLKCQQLANKPLIFNSSIDRRPIDNSPTEISLAENKKRDLISLH